LRIIKDYFEVYVVFSSFGGECVSSGGGIVGFFPAISGITFAEEWFW
jgi:hypothetical protein